MGFFITIHCVKPNEYEYNKQHMKKTLILLTFLSFIAVSQAGMPQAIKASGVETTSNSQVGVMNQDGVMYLTTETTGTSSSDTVRTATSTSAFGPVLPRGFATDISQLISFLLRFVMILATLLVLFQLIMGAFDWITSGGDKGKTDRARQRIISAIVGIIIIAASFAIANLVTRFLGFSSFSDVFLQMKNIQGSPAPIVTPVPATSSAVPAVNP